MADAGLLALKWEELRRRAEGDGRTELALEASPDVEGMWLALSRSGGLRVLLALDAEEGGGVPDLGPQSALEVVVHEVSLAGSTRRCIDIRCVVSGLDDVFRLFVAVLLRKRAELRPPAAVAGAIKELFDLLGLTAGSRQRNLGDLGELWVLSRLQGLGSHAIEAWTGPATGRHDFTRGRVALEVKAGLRPHRTVTISDVGQLEPPPDGRLFLIVMTLEADPAGELSVGGLANRVRADVAPTAPIAPEVDAKLKRLCALGERHSYRLHETRVFEISEDTPRLRPPMLKGVPPSVEGLSYRLGLGHLGPWELNARDHDTALRLVLP